MSSLFGHTVSGRHWTVVLSIVLVGAVPVSLGFLTASFGIVVPIVSAVLALVSIYLVFLFRNSVVGMTTLLFLAFFFPAIGRDLVAIPLVAFDLIMVFTWLAVLYTYKGDWTFAFKNDLTVLMLLWFAWSLVQVVNPGASIAGWIRELRLSALFPLLLVPLGLLAFSKVKYLNFFLVTVIVFSLLAALNGIKQEHIGLSPGEQHFLDVGNHVTHVLWGQLRVFSFYMDAGQFGASQAQVGLMALILAFGPFKPWKRVLLFIAAALMLYGMLISGTRGALFALLVGAVVGILLWGNWKVILIGSFVCVGFFCFLKFTHIGSGNYALYRLRTALDPQDASFNVRLENQERLQEYLSTRPFGDGLGTIGYFGEQYNPGTYLSTVAPDSYWVKIWAMYGIVGFVLWFGMMMYILGRCCGIVWVTKDEGLRVKLLALTAGYAGILFCSYGNEVMNNQPSLFVMLMSWCLVFLGPRFDREIEEEKKRNILKS